LTAFKPWRFLPIFLSDRPGIRPASLLLRRTVLATVNFQQPCLWRGKANRRRIFAGPWRSLLGC
jgi:hypothetical protein